MKWLEISARNFGPLKDWRCLPSPEITVFLGKNETGKSTIMELMCTLLFGATRRKNEPRKLISWGTDKADLNGVLSLNNGSDLSIHRTIFSNTMKGSILQNGTAQELDDLPIPGIEPINRSLYRNVFALSLQDLLFPNKETWNMFQDLLSSSQQQRSASEVRDQLFRVAMNRWRPDRRAKTECDLLNEQLEKEYSALQHSKNAAEEIIRLKEDLSSWKQKLSDLRQEQLQLQRELDRYTPLLEIAMLRDEAKASLDALGDMSSYLTLPENLVKHVEELQAQQQTLSFQVSSSGQRIAKLRSSLEQRTEEAQQILSHEKEIRTLFDQAAEFQNQQAALLMQSEKLTSLKNEVLSYANAELFSAFTAEDLNTVDPQRIKTLAEDAVAADESKKESFAELKKEKRNPRPLFPYLFIILALISSSLGFLALTSERFFPRDWRLAAVFFFSGAVCFGLCLLLRGILRRKRIAPFRSKYERTQKEEQSALLALQACFARFPLKKEITEQPDRIISPSLVFADLLQKYQ